MKISRFDFLRLLGGGSAAAGAGLSYGGALRIPGLEPASPPSPELLESLEPLRKQYLEIVDAYLYDRVSIAPGRAIPEHINMFATPVGQPCPYSGDMKTGVSTNLYLSGMLPAPSSFVVQRMQFLMPETSTASDIAVAQRSAWRFMIGQKRYHASLTISNLRLRESADGGVYIKPAPDSIRDLDFPNTAGLYLPPMGCFAMEITTPGGAAVGPFDITVVLKGLEARGLQ